MKKTLWEKIQPIHITGEQVRDAFDWLRAHPAGRGGSASELRLPPAEEFCAGLQFQDFITPVDAVNLNGYRLTQTEDPGRPYAEQLRVNGRVTIRHIFRSEKHPVPWAVRDMPLTLGRQLRKDIEHHFYQLLDGPGFVPEHRFQSIEYSPGLLKQLLLQTLIEPTPPEIVPSIVFPSAEELLTAMHDITSVKWEYAYDHFLWIEREKNGFVVKVRGERGTELLHKSVSSLAEAALCMTEFIFSARGTRSFTPTSNFT